MQSKVNDLEITKQVDQIAVEKKTLELDLQKSHTFLYLVLSLLILSVAIAVFVFFRLGKIQSLYKHLQETNNLLDLARKKAEESEQMKNSFIKNMCHEVRTPLNAINGFAELISDEGASTEEKKEFSRIIFANCNDITSMMNNVLVISEMDNSHSMDRTFLKERAYPFIKDVAIFLEQMTKVNNDGIRTLTTSTSPEIFDNSAKAWFKTITNYDLSLIRFVFGAASELAGELKLSDEASHWSALKAQLPSFDLDAEGALTFAKGFPYDQSHRHFSHVRLKGLEPPRREASDPKSDVATNYTTTAFS